MQIRRNTKPFKSLLHIISVCHDRADRQQLIRLFITKAGNSVNERIPIEGTQSEASFFYDLNYQAVLNNLKSPNHQLHLSDDIPGLYYFRSNISVDWDETPFEFDAAILKEFSTLPELPATRVKGKSQEFVIPVQTTSSVPKKLKKDVPLVKAPTMFINREVSNQPDYKLKQQIIFTDLERIVFRQPGISKKEILDHYNRISEYILPYLKDRPLYVRQQADSGPAPRYATINDVPKKYAEVPKWIKTTDPEPSILCNDVEHLLQYVEFGSIEFDVCLSKVKSIDSPDVIIIAIDSGADFNILIEVTLTMKEICDGLRLPAFVKTDAASGFHIYIPLDSKSEYEDARRVAEIICKLTRLKLPDLVSVKGSDNYEYGKVSLDYLVNENSIGVIAPYSFAPGRSATIATPLLWEEVNEHLRIDEFNSNTIFDRLKNIDDPFEGLFKKKVNAIEISERLEANYSFLI